MEKVSGFHLADKWTTADVSSCDAKKLRSRVHEISSDYWRPPACWGNLDFYWVTILNIAGCFAHCSVVSTCCLWLQCLCEDQDSDAVGPPGWGAAVKVLVLQVWRAISRSPDLSWRRLAQSRTHSCLIWSWSSWTGRTDSGFSIKTLPELQWQIINKDNNREESFCSTSSFLEPSRTLKSFTTTMRVYWWVYL